MYICASYVSTVFSILNFLLPAIGIHDYGNGNGSFFIKNGFNCAEISEMLKLLPFLRNQDILILTRNFETVESCSQRSYLLVQNRFIGLWSLDKLISTRARGFTQIHILYLPTSVSEVFEVMGKQNMEMQLFGRNNPVLINWPKPIMTFAKQNFYPCLSTHQRQKFMTDLLRKMRIRLEVILIFKIVCNNDYETHPDPEIIWSVWETYKFAGESINQNVSMQEMFYTNVNTQMSIKTIQTKLQRRKDFQHIVIRAVAPYFIEFKLEVDWDEDEKGEIKFIGGMAVNILRDIETILNFSIEFIPGDFFITSTSPSLNLSSNKPTTASLLQERKVEIMIGHTTPMPNRLKSLDILFPSAYNRLYAFIHQPSASYTRDIAYPFHHKLWIAFIVLWTVILLYTKMSAKILEIRDPFTQFFIFWTFALFPQQSFESPPTNSHLRRAFFFSILLTTVCFNAYSAAVVSVLQLEEIPIPDLYSLFRSTLPIHAAVESSNIAFVVKGLQSEGKVKEKQPFLVSSVGVPKLFQRPSAFITYNHLFHMERQRGNINDVEYCSKITALPVTRTNTPTSMVMPKGSSLKETFNHKILLLRERGHLYRHQTHFHESSSLKCPKSESPYKSPLEVDDLTTPLVIQLFGLLLTLPILLIEMFLRKCTKTQEQHPLLR